MASLVTPSLSVETSFPEDRRKPCSAQGLAGAHGASHTLAPGLINPHLQVRKPRLRKLKITCGATPGQASLSPHGYCFHEALGRP